MGEGCAAFNRVFVFFLMILTIIGICLSRGVSVVYYLDTLIYLNLLSSSIHRYVYFVAVQQRLYSVLTA
jgi:hypothetical protein